MMRRLVLLGAVGTAAAWDLERDESQCLGSAGSYGSDKQCLPSVRVCVGLRSCFGWATHFAVPRSGSQPGT